MLMKEHDDISPAYEQIRDTPICFIVGMGRSGTTLLTNILNANDQVISVPENNFVLFAKALMHREYQDKQELFAAFKETLSINHNHVFSVWDPNLDAMEQAQRGFVQMDYATLCKLAYLSTRNTSAAGVRAIVDKNPVYSLFVGDLIEIFPDAKFIILTRDYRDNIASRRKYTGGIVSSTLYNLADTWRNYYKQIEKWQSRFPGKFMYLRYEDLVSQTGTEIHRICGFIDIPVQENMFHPEKNLGTFSELFNVEIDARAKARINEMHGRLTQAIDVTKVNSWGAAFTAREVEVLETICGETGLKYGYMPTRQVSAVKRSLICLQWYLAMPLFIALNKGYHWFYYKSPLKIRAIVLGKKAKRPN